MQISLVFSINRVFCHNSHHPPRCLDNCADYGRQFHEDDRDTRSQSQNEEGLSRLFLQVTSVGFWHNLPRWSISEGLIGWCLSVIMKFTYSFFCWLSFTGQVSVKIILPNKRFYCVFNYYVPFKRRHRERRPFVSERDFRQNDFQTSRWLSAVFVLQNLDMMLGSLSRDKWRLNNYYAIGIKNKGFCALSVTIPYDHNLTSKLKLRSAIFS